MGCIYRAGIYRTGIYRTENCKNYFKIEGKIIFKKKNDMAADMTQCESSSIKRYVSAFSNI